MFAERCGGESACLAAQDMFKRVSNSIRSHYSPISPDQVLLPNDDPAVEQALRDVCEAAHLVE